jgi:hypothetical protein
MRATAAPIIHGIGQKKDKEFQEWIRLFSFNLVRPILGQPFLRLGFTEAVRR